MKNKKWLLLLIILLPSLFWVILESSTINSHRLPVYGPRTLSASADTIYHSVPDNLFQAVDGSPFIIDKHSYPLYVIMFLRDSYKPESYRLAGLYEFWNYKQEKIAQIPFFLVTGRKEGKSEIADSLSALGRGNISFLTVHDARLDSVNKLYFKEKPVYIDYSFMVLVDANRNVRGYYDSRFAAEVKRLSEEYRHLRLKDEKQKLIESNEIKKH